MCDENVVVVEQEVGLELRRRRLEGADGSVDLPRSICSARSIRVTGLIARSTEGASAFKICSSRDARTIVVKSLAAIVNLRVEVAGSNFGSSIAASRDLSASLTMPAMAKARAVGCMPVVVRMNNSSSSISLRRASEWLTADWLRKTFWLARRTLRSSITASNTRSRLRSSVLKETVISRPGLAASAGSIFDDRNGTDADFLQHIRGPDQKYDPLGLAFFACITAIGTHFRPDRTERCAFSSCNGFTSAAPNSRE